MVFDGAVHLAKKDAKVTQLGDTPTLGLYKGRESSEDDLWRCCGESNASPERLVRCFFVMIVVKEEKREEQRLARALTLKYSSPGLGAPF